MSFFTRVQKFNPYHGKDGRFTSSGGVGGEGTNFISTTNRAAVDKIKEKYNAVHTPPHPETNAAGAYNAYRDRKDLIAAFADANQGWDRGASKRSLHYVTGREMSVDAFREAMGKAIPGTYNKYSTARVANYLSKFGDKIKVSPGREYSPVVYVHGDPATLQEVARNAKRFTRANEIDMQPAGTTTWSEADQQRYSKHTGGPDTFQPSGRRFKDSTLRLWWD